MSFTQRLVPLGFQQITSLAAATGLTVPPGAQVAVIVSETMPVRYRDDGSAPTGSIGQLLPVGSVLEYAGTLSAIRFIQTAASATLDISYYSLAG